MRLVGYIRVSTQGQEDNTSLDEQRRRIEAYCTAYGHDLAEVFTEVGSGKDTESRPVFRQALEVARQHDGLVALKLDRIARNTRDVLTLVEDVLQPENKALVLLDLNVDTSTPTGRMILTVMAAVAQLERDVIAERTQGGRRAKAEAGGYAFGAPPYGWDAVDGVLIESPQEQETIKVIRRHKRSGKSFRAIAAYLNREGIPSKRGRKWTHPLIKAVLDRRTSEQAEPAA